MNSIALIIGVVLVIALLLGGAWYWYTHTPEYLAAQKTKQAAQDALDATDVNGTGLQRGVYDTLEAAEAQRRLGVAIDPGLEGLRPVRNAYLAIPNKWQEERSTNVSDPVRRISIMENLAGMFEANTQMFIAGIPFITTKEGLNAYAKFYLQVMKDAIDRRNCWFERLSGCWRDWSVGEPHEMDRALEEQRRIRDFSRRVLGPLEDRAEVLRMTPLFTPAELSRLHSDLLHGTAAQNPFDEATYNEITGWLS